MHTDLQQNELSDVQRAIYRVALSLDSLFLNGVPYGVLNEDLSSGFLQKVATNLSLEVAGLERQSDACLPTK
jgi:hypothetical protein